MSYSTISDKKVFNTNHVKNPLENINVKKKFVEMEGDKVDIPNSKGDPQGMDFHIEIPIDTVKGTLVDMDNLSFSMGSGDMLMMVKDGMEGKGNLFNWMVFKVNVLKERVNSLYDKLKEG